MTNKKNDYVLAKSTNAITTDYYRKEKQPNGSVPNKQNSQSLLNIVKSDPELRGLMAIEVNSLTKSGYTLNGSMTAKKTAIELLKKLRFKKRLRQVYWNLLIYKNVFIEIFRNSKNKPTSLNILEGNLNIKPIVNKFNDVIKYVQEVTPDGSRNYREWKPDSLVHISMDELDSSIWGSADLDTLKSIIKDKSKVLDHIEWLFSTNQFRNHMHFKGQLSPEDIKSNIELIKASMKDTDKFLITTGTEDMKSEQLVSPSDLDNYIRLLDYYRQIQMTSLQIPPIIGGTIEGSNRSSAEVQARYVYPTTLKAFQIILDEELNSELFPLLNLNVEIEHNPIDIKEEKDYIEQASVFLNNNADPKKVEEWLQSKGIDIPNNFFLKKELMEPNSLPQNSNQFPSRKPRDNEAIDRKTPEEMQD